MMSCGMAMFFMHILLLQVCQLSDILQIVDSVRNMSYHPQPREHVSLFYSDDYFAMKLQWKTMKDVQKNNFVQFRDRESLIGEL